MQQKRALNINYPLCFCNQGDHMICQEKERDHLDSIQQVLSDESFISVHELPIMEVGGRDRGRPRYEIECL